MDKNEISRRALEHAELNALTLQMIARIKQGDTLPRDSIYHRLMMRLQKRAQELGSQPSLPLENATDWLALALFAEDRKRFFRLYALALKNPEEPVFSRAKPWLSRFIRDEQSVGSQEEASTPAADEAQTGPKGE